MSPSSTTGLGQGSFEIGEKPVAEQQGVNFDLSRRMAASTLIKLVSDLHPPDPGEVTERDVRVMSPGQIASGLFVKTDHFGRSDVDNSYQGVVFPPEQFVVIARSPVDMARHTKARAEKAHANEHDKQLVDARGKKAAGLTLTSHLSRIQTFRSGLQDQLKLLRAFAGELHGANNTGYFAHYKAQNLMLLKATAETAIYEALDVSALTKAWEKETYERARRTINYQLYGNDSPRLRNWIGYTDLAVRYANVRDVIMGQSERRVRRELDIYQPYLDEVAA